MIVASNIDEKTLKRDGVCAASLPTTMGIVAGFLVQNTLKYLLKFGQVTNYLGYNALTDFFPTMNLKPNENCEDSNCRLRQKEYAAKPKLEMAVEAKEDDNKPVHEDNEWGISLVDESADNETEDKNVCEGIKLSYIIPSKSQNVEEGEEVGGTQNLDDLMAQMKAL